MSIKQQRQRLTYQPVHIAAREHILDDGELLRGEFRLLGRGNRLGRQAANLLLELGDPLERNFDLPCHLAPPPFEDPLLIGDHLRSIC